MLMENAEVNSLGCINSECSSTKCMIYFENTEIHHSITFTYKNPHSLYSQENLLTGYS